MEEGVIPMRRAQAAIEYLFMIAVALVIVLITIRLLRRTSQTAAEQIDRASEEVLELLRNMTNNQS